MALFAIYDPTRGKYAAHYNTRQLPALYDRKVIAEEILVKKKRRMEVPAEAIVVSVELKQR